MCVALGSGHARGGPQPGNTHARTTGGRAWRGINSEGPQSHDGASLGSRTPTLHTRPAHRPCLTSATGIVANADVRAAGDGAAPLDTGGLGCPSWLLARLRVRHTSHAAPTRSTLRNAGRRRAIHTSHAFRARARKGSACSGLWAVRAPPRHRQSRRACASSSRSLDSPSPCAPPA